MTLVEPPPQPLKRWGEAVAALGFNLIPIAGVLFWHWSVFTLVFLYWLENVVIGVRTLASMLASGWAEGGPGSFAGTIPLCIFFTVHYGLFCFVHGVFVVSLFGGGPAYAAIDLPATAHAVLAVAPNLAAGLVSIIIWQGVLFVLFLIRGEAKTAQPMTLMASPYPRIIALHVTIIGGGFLVMMLGQPVWALLVLALIKTAFDVAPRVPGAKPPTFTMSAGPWKRVFSSGADQR